MYTALAFIFYQANKLIDWLTDEKAKAVVKLQRGRVSHITARVAMQLRCQEILLVNQSIS